MWNRYSLPHIYGHVWKVNFQSNVINQNYFCDLLVKFKEIQAFLKGMIKSNDQCIIYDTKGQVKNLLCSISHLFLMLQQKLWSMWRKIWCIPKKPGAFTFFFFCQCQFYLLLKQQILNGLPKKNAKAHSKRYTKKPEKVLA